MGVDRCAGKPVIFKVSTLAFNYPIYILVLTLYTLKRHNILRCKLSLTWKSIRQSMASGMIFNVCLRPYLHLSS